MNPYKNPLLLLYFSASAFIVSGRMRTNGSARLALVYFGAGCFLAGAFAALFVVKLISTFT